jgi:hypothetical protein
MDDTMVTTPDNPWNPYTQFDEWYAFDAMMGYNTCGILARLACTSRELSDEQNEEAIDKAQDEMTKGIYKGIFIKVNKDSFKDGKIIPVS